MKTLNNSQKRFLKWCLKQGHSLADNHRIINHRIMIEDILKRNKYNDQKGLYQHDHLMKIRRFFEYSYKQHILELNETE